MCNRFICLFVMLCGSLTARAEYQCSFQNGLRLEQAKNLLELSVLDQPPFLYERQLLIQMGADNEYCEPLIDIHTFLSQPDDSEVGQFLLVASETYNQVEGNPKEGKNQLAAKIDRFRAALGAINPVSVNDAIPGYQDLLESCTSEPTEVQTEIPDWTFQYEQFRLAVDAVEAIVAGYQRIYQDETYTRFRIKQLFLESYDKAIAYCAS